MYESSLKVGSDVVDSRDELLVEVGSQDCGRGGEVLRGGLDGSLELEQVRVVVRLVVLDSVLHVAEGPWEQVVEGGEATGERDGESGEERTVVDKDGRREGEGEGVDEVWLEVVAWVVVGEDGGLEVVELVVGGRGDVVVLGVDEVEFGDGCGSQGLHLCLQGVVGADDVAVQHLLLDWGAGVWLDWGGDGLLLVVVEGSLWLVASSWGRVDGHGKREW